MPFHNLYPVVWACFPVQPKSPALAGDPSTLGIIALDWKANCNCPTVPDCSRTFKVTKRVTFCRRNGSMPMNCDRSNGSESKFETISKPAAPPAGGSDDFWNYPRAGGCRGRMGTLESSGKAAFRHTMEGRP